MKTFGWELESVMKSPFKANETSASHISTSEPRFTILDLLTTNSIDWVTSVEHPPDSGDKVTVKVTTPVLKSVGPGL